MKMVLLLFVLFWQSYSIAGQDCSGQDICMNMTDPVAKLTYKPQNLSCEIEGELTVTCLDKGNLKANISIDSVCCGFSEMNNGVTHSDSNQGTSMPATTTIQTMASHKMIATQPINDCKCQAAESITSLGLGVAVGLLIVLLIIVTVGWIWTYWIMKKQARIHINSENISKCVPIDLLSNPSYRNDQQTLQNHPLPIPTPTYETIPPMSDFLDGIKLDLAEPKEGCGAGNNREEAHHKLNRAQRDSKKRGSTDQTHKSGHREGYQEKERVTEPSSGTGPQDIQYSFANTSTKLLLDSVVPSEEGKSGNLMDIGKTSQENETTNSSMKKNDNELNGTTLEHYQTETSEKEQDIPKKWATPRDYELAVPSK